MSEEGNNKPFYPLSDFYTFEDGVDIVRTNNKIVALVVVSQGNSKTMRFYAWRKKNVDGEDKWKVELARMDCKGWNWEKISTLAMQLKQKHGLISS